MKAGAFLLFSYEGEWIFGGRKDAAEAERISTKKSGRDRTGKRTGKELDDSRKRKAERFVEKLGVVESQDLE